MENQLLTGEDVRFLAQQPDYEVNLMVGQMTTLMQNINDLQQDTDDKVAQLENQGWFKRLCNTVLGKNKATRQEIQKNNDKMVTYISQSVSQLYQMNLINEKMLCSLGNRMNEIYMQVAMNYQEQLSMKSQISELMAVQQQTLDNLGAFVSKLNEKIESVDNFHMLISEIQNGMYHDSSKLYNLCVIISQLDKRQMDDERKMNLLRDTMERAGVITDDEISVLQCLQDIVALPQEKIGLIYLELCNFRNSFPANLFADMIESYHFLSKMERMSKKKETIIQKLLDKYELESSAEFSLADVSDSFLENKLNSLVEVNTFQISMQSSNETEKNNQTSDVSETSSDKTEHSDSNTATDTTSACEVSYDNAPHTNDNGTAPNTLNEKSEPVAPATVVPPAITENEVASENTSDSLNDFSDVDRSEIEDVVNDLMEEINNFNFNSEYENENDELFEYDDSIECDPDDYNEEELESKTKAKAACKKALNSAIADVIEQYSTTKL